MRWCFFMKTFIFFGFASGVCGNKIKCEEYNRCYGGYCCEVKKYTVIDTDNHTFSDPRNETVKSIDFENNKDIQFLPVESSEKFPKITRLFANNCSIKDIFRKNFVGLTVLERVEFDNNQIEIIRSDTFQNLVRVERIVLSKNKIKRMNSKLFDVLPRLHRVELDGNVCITGYFLSYDRIEHLLELVDKQCGFSEIDGKEFECEVIKRSVNYNQSCSLRNYTSIYSPDISFTGARNTAVREIDCEGNKKIFYLPIDVSTNFPSLRGFNAFNCSIQHIGKENFDKLYDLKTINLGKNQIRAIKSDTFEGLFKLVIVYLYDNQIASMSGRLFENLPRLDLVALHENVCINERFDGVEAIQRLSKEVTQRCAFSDTSEVAFEKLFNLRCGTVPYATGYIIGGSEAKRGQWPFMVAMVYLPLNKFFCGSSLITNRHVLSAAHCIQQKFVSGSFEAKDIEVLLGRHNLKETLESGAETRGLASITVHPDWRQDNQKYDADLAVLTMNATVDFTNFIQPVCLTDDLDIFNYEDGYVVGWGHDGGSAAHQDKLKQVLVRSVNDSTCFSRDHTLGSIYSPRHFCASGEDAGPCSGDSGSGFFVKFRGLWTLRGTVSAGAFKSAGGCDVGRFALYSKLTEYATWILKVVEETSRTTTSVVTRKYVSNMEWN